MIVHFPTTLDVRLHGYEQGSVWQVLADFIIVAEPFTERQRIIRVPSGQMSDFASVPRAPGIYLAYADKFHKAALGHDLLYTLGGTQADKDYADQFFLAGMLATVTAYQTAEDAQAMYTAVHLFGASHFNWTTGTREEG